MPNPSPIRVLLLPIEASDGSESPSSFAQYRAAKYLFAKYLEANIRSHPG